MENCREDLRSILPFLPLILRSSAVYWPPAVIVALQSLSKGPIHSNVDSGQTLALAISDLRSSIGFPSLHSSASLGFFLFFDDLMSKDEGETWFKEVVPRLADILLRLPELLETHYQNAGLYNGMETGLRILESQQSGIVFLSQELIAALLVCALLCLFPAANRSAKRLPPINFDKLFMSLYERYDVRQENKIKCIVHYFERICLHLSVGNVSFQRKVLPLKNNLSSTVSEVEFWSKSIKSLCQLEVRPSGLIENQSGEALEVDFADKYIGGGALRGGCLQEEIRFMINPELIVSMLFMPSMADNEAIEIVGAERFSNYSGYASSFRFCGDYIDKKDFDSFRRRKTRVIAIDALPKPGKRQYGLECLLRETNKAFCGFLDQHKIQQCLPADEIRHPGADPGQDSRTKNNILTADSPNVISQYEKNDIYQIIGDERPHDEVAIGVATGNWGCGAFGGDPEVKVVIQWLAASQAFRPFILYYTFGLDKLQKLEEVVQWIVSHNWTVGELWNMLVEYSAQRLKGKTKIGFFSWLLPSKYDDDPMILDVSHTT